MPTRHATRPLLTGLTGLAVSLLVAACGASTATPAPTTAPSAVPAPTTAPATTAAPSAATAASPTPSAQPSTGHIQLPDKGFGLTLPDGWQSLPVDPAALAEVVKSLPEGSDMRNLLEGQLGSSALQSITFWAFDLEPDSTPDSTPNMNIIAQPASTFDLSLVDSSVKAQLGAVNGVGEITSQVVNLPAGEAIRFDYDLDLGGPGASGASASGTPATVATTQYYVQLPKTTLIISFSTDKAAAADAAPDFEAIIQSLEAVS